MNYTRQDYEFTYDVFAGHSFEEVSFYLQQQFYQLQLALANITANINNYPILYAAPQNPVEGQLVYADGTLWNPGSGRGLYVCKWVTDKLSWVFIK